MENRYRKERSIKFMNLDGKEEEYQLLKEEVLINIKCPLDQTPLTEEVVNCGNWNEFLIKCPNCKIEYDSHNLSPKGLDSQLERYIGSYHKRLERVEIEKKQLDREKIHLMNIINYFKAQSLPKCTINDK